MTATAKRPVAIPSRSRRGVPKSRSGCIVCRSRHLKCDELKPQCQKCISTDRQCEYPSRTSSLVIKLISFESPPPRSLSHSPDSDLLERRALSYFQHRAGCELGGICFPDLWTTSILPISTYDETIRHAVVALASLHEDYVTHHQTVSTHSRYALHQYGLAVDGLVRLNLATNPHAVDIALTSCVIFASLEMIRGHVRSALSHIISGKKISNQEQANSLRKRNPSVHHQLINDVFRWMETQMLSIESALVPLVDRSERSLMPCIPGSFGSAQEALAALDAFHNHICHFFSEAARFLVLKKHQPEAFDYLAPELIELERVFEAWRQAFLPISEYNVTSKDPAVLLLKILLRFGYTMFPASRHRHGTQLDHDAFIKEFGEMADWAEEYLHLTSKLIVPHHPELIASADTKVEDGGSRNKSSPDMTLRKLVPKPDPVVTPTFSMSTGIVPSLYVVGAKCRDPKIRRKALRLLQKCKRREGIWDSNVVGHIVEKVISIEEGNALRELGTDSSGVITDASQISLAARVYVCNIKFGPERSMTMEYRTEGSEAGCGPGQEVFREVFPP